MSHPVSVVIPAYHEEAVVGNVVESVRRVLGAANIEHEIIVVDDGSTDATGERARAAGAKVQRHPGNRGYGAALKTGVLAAQYDHIAITDADGTYPIERLPELVKELEQADMVVAARIGENVHIPLLRRPAKWVLNRLANYITQSEIQDLNSGMRIFPKSTALQYFNILPDQFSFTSTITIAMLCDRYAVRYLPIDYHRRTGQSKIVASDAATFATLIVRTAMLFRPLRVFLPVVLAFFAYGTIKGTFDYVLDGFFSATATLALMGSIQFLLMGLIADAIARHLNHLGVETSARLVQLRQPAKLTAERMNRAKTKTSSPTPGAARRRNKTSQKK